MRNEKDLISPCCNAPVTREFASFFYKCTKCGIENHWKIYYEDRIEKNRKIKEDTGIKKRLEILEARVSYLESKIVKKENKKETDNENAKLKAALKVLLEQD
jgi:hypothetical protein